MSDEGYKKSKLLPVGIVLLLSGLFLPRIIADLAQQMHESIIRSILFISTDVLRICAIVGILVSIMGAVKNKQLKREYLQKNNIAHSKEHEDS